MSKKQPITPRPLLELLELAEQRERWNREVGESLRRARHRCRPLPRQLAEALEASQAYVSQVEHGKGSVNRSAAALPRAAAASEEAAEGEDEHEQRRRKRKPQPRRVTASCTSRSCSTSRARCRRSRRRSSRATTTTSASFATQGGETLYSLTTFNTHFKHVCVGEPLDAVAAARPPALPAGRDDGALRRDRAHGARDRPPLQADGRGDGEGARRRDDRRARELLHRLRRARDRGTGAQLRRAAELDVRLPRRRPRQHHATRSRRRRTWATSATTRCSGRTTRPRHASRCARSAMPPSIAARRALKSEQFFADAGQGTSDYQHEAPDPPQSRTVDQ